MTDTKSTTTRETTTRNPCPRCTRCGLPEDALLHHATANGHRFSGPTGEEDIKVHCGGPSWCIEPGRWADHPDKHSGRLVDLSDDGPADSGGGWQAYLMQDDGELPVIRVVGCFLNDGEEVSGTFTLAGLTMLHYALADEGARAAMWDLMRQVDEG